MKNVLLVCALILCAISTAGQKATDPGPRAGTSGAGSPVAGLSPGQMAYFLDGQIRFQEIENVRQVPGQNSPNNGLGPAFNSNQCSSCHSQPAIGGTSPSVNPEFAVGVLDGADNKIPSFIEINGPAREARFVYQLNPNGELSTTPDGAVHELFTIQGRADAAGCVMAQPPFDLMLALHNIIFRIPTPVFGTGLVEAIQEQTILDNQSSQAWLKKPLGIAGIPNRSGNDGTITRFGWKAQNKSLAIFAGEAYNVEVGVTNELFPNERGLAHAPPPKSCLFNNTPEDTTNFDTANPLTQIPSDVVAFANFMRMLDQPQPACTGTGCSASIQNGRHLFTDVVKCSLCHTPSMTSGPSFTLGLSNIPVNLFSDLLVHHMGTELADGVSQGAAGPDQFRSSPLWGLGQRLFFLHDGRTGDLLQAIKAHQSPGSEANLVVRIFLALRDCDQQDLLNFLRSL